MRKTLTASFAIAAVALAAAPASAQLGMPSDRDQVTLGTRAAEEIRRKERVLPNSDERVRVVRRIGNQLVASIDKQNLPWQFSFDVIQSNDVNAFALPGGPVFIYTGLLDKLETEDELAGIMGHEIGHVIEEHWARQYAEQQKRGLLLGLLLGVTRANQTWQTLANVANISENMRYSRTAEVQSDDIGFDLVLRAGYNPLGMADVFRMFQRQRRSGLRIPFLESHPSDDSRIANIERKVAALNQTLPTQRPLRYTATNSSRDFSWWRVR